MPRIGFNVCENPIDDKSTLLQNCLNSNPGLEEGILYRRMFVAAAGDATSFEEPFAGDDAYQKIVPESFWAGADYRVLNGAAAGRRGRIVSCSYAGKAKTVFTVGDTGPAFAAGDLILVSQPDGKGRVAASYPANATEYVAEGEHAPFHGGKTCIKLDAKTFKFDLWKIPYVWLPHFKRWGGGRTGDREGNADRFLQEKAYRISLWAKGTPGAKGSVRFVASSEPGAPEPDDFVLTDTWKKYELIRKSDPMVNIIVVLSGGDEMYFDNFVISEDDGGEPLAILPRVTDALADLKPGTLRLLGGARGESLDNWLAHPLERLRTVEYHPANRSTEYRDPDQPNLPHSLVLCERTGATPWLVMGLAMTDEEWDHLLEYLAGPPDSPYGAKRVRNGQPESWLKTFDTIYLELGDEVWNANKSPWNLKDPALYAAWAERVFSRVRKSKYFSTGKIRLVASGCAADPKWNEAVLKGCKSLDILNCPAALGVRQPAAGKPADLASMQLNLLACPVAQLLPQLTSAAQLAKAAGKTTAMGGCETVSAETSFLGQERSLLRSETAAVAILDGMLLALAGGSEAVQFSRFAQGSDNATHVDAHTMALHPAAEAIRLYNVHAAGLDLVSATVAPTPQNGSAPGVPALAAYAFKGRSGYRLFLLNRSVNTACRATVALPLGSGKVRCYQIASDDPLANNLNEIRVRTAEPAGDPASGVVVPAHGIVLVETGEGTK